MSDINKILGSLSTPLDVRIKAMKDVSTIVRELVFEQKVLDGTRWSVEYGDLMHHSSKVFGEYHISKPIFDALFKFGEIFLYEYPIIHKYSRSAKLVLHGDNYGGTDLVISFPTGVTKEEIKEFLDKTGIIVLTDGLDADVKRAKKNYDAAVKERERWNF